MSLSDKVKFESYDDVGYYEPEDVKQFIKELKEEFTKVKGTKGNKLVDEICEVFKETIDELAGEKLLK